MDDYLFDKIQERVPKMNPVIANGIVVQEMALFEQHIDRIFRQAAASFPEEVKYEGFQRCTPMEEYVETTRKRSNKHTFELAQSDVYLVKYFFSFAGRPLPPKYLYMPFVGDAGTITIRGSSFVISPVLADKAISVGKDSIFIHVGQANLTFNRMIHTFIKDGKSQATYVIKSKIHNHNPNKANRNVLGDRTTVKPEHLLVHYMFCQHGVTGTFKKFVGADVVVGTQDINHDNYPAKDWVICSSTGLCPKTVGDKYYRPCQLRMAIRKEQYNSVVASFVASFFYVADHFPTRIKPEYVDEIRLWRVLLGHAIFRNEDSEGMLIRQIDTHLDTLDGFVQGMVKENLRSVDVDCDDIYGLFLHVIETLSDRVINTDISDVYDKRLSCIRYTSYDIVSAIFTLMFRLQAKTKKPATEKEVIRALDQLIKPELILGLNTSRHGEVTSIATPGDCKLFKITSNVILQADAAAKSKHKGDGMLTDASKFLNAGVAEVGSYTHLPKSEPSGRSRLNMHVRTAPDGSIMADPDKAELIAATQKIIQR